DDPATTVCAIYDARNQRDILRGIGKENAFRGSMNGRFTVKLGSLSRISGRYPHLKGTVTQLSDIEPTI
ncbi:MAG: hypothetical protein WBN59_08445, partial [Flavobacteriaceae bacterium]